MRTITLSLSSSDEKIVRELINDFYTGYIANPSRRADGRRLKYERWLRSKLQPKEAQ